MAHEPRNTSAMTSKCPLSSPSYLYWYTPSTPYPTKPSIPPERVTSNTSQPQRALTHIKKSYPAPTLEAAFLACYDTMWNGQIDISKPEHLATALGKVFRSEQEVRDVIAAASSPQIKADLSAVTERAVKELGAYGCPWFWVTNGEGKSEPFFGSDRWHFMWQFLELPFEDLRLIPAAGSKL